MYENYEKIIHAKGLTNYKVSKDTGIAQSVLSTWKNGGTTPRVEKLQILADYLCVPMDALVSANERDQWYIDEETAKVAQEILSDPDRRALFEASAGCKPEYLRIASEMLLKLKETNPNG